MAKGVPPGYTRFLQQFLNDLPTLAEQRSQDLADRFRGAVLLKSDYQARLTHPLMSSLLWSFRQNKITRSKVSKTFNVEFAPRNTSFPTQSDVERAWRDSGLDGDLGTDEEGYFFQREWGYGRETDRLTNDRSLINALRAWAIDAMSVAIKLVENSGNGDNQIERGLKLSSASDAPQRVRTGRAFPSEGLLEDLIIEDWQKLDFGNDLEFLERQKPCGNIGIIDILARDRQSRAYVVVELKKSAADDEVFGQLARYMGWVKEHLADPEGVGIEGIIIASRITPRLTAAVASHPGVRILRYEVDESQTAQSTPANTPLGSERVLRIALGTVCACGTRNPQGAQYCRRCGVPVSATNLINSVPTAPHLEGSAKHPSAWGTAGLALVLSLLLFVAIFFLLR